MSFGKPSSTVFTCSEPASRSSPDAAAAWNVDSRLELEQHPPNTKQHHAHAPLHFADVRAQIQELNRQFPPVLTEYQLLSVEEDVYREIKHLLGRPLEEVFAEACATWTNILVRAKGGEEDTEIEDVEEERSQGLSEQAAPPAHT